MANPNKILALAIFTLAVISLEVVEARKCYVCFYTKNETIAAQFEDLNLDLGKNMPSCVSSPSRQDDFIKGEVCLSVEATLTTGDTIVIRGARIGPAENKCDTNLDLLDELLDGDQGDDLKALVKEANICFCLDDGCNGADGNSGMNLVLSPAALIFPVLGLALSSVFSSS